MKFFCPKCHWEMPADVVQCSHCGYDLNRWQRLDYDQKLIQALSHNEVNTRMRAARLLGLRRIRNAIPELQKQFLFSQDPYFQAEVMEALFDIDKEAAKIFFRQTLTGKESVILERTWEQLRKN